MLSRGRPGSYDSFCSTAQSKAVLVHNMNLVDHVCGVRDDLKTFVRLLGGVVWLNSPCSHLPIGPFL